MNCQSCSARIDYLFVTNCAYCGSKIEASGVPQINSLPELPVAKRPVWKATLVNIAYTFASSAAGMISGAVVAYCLVGAAYQIFFRASDNAHSGCGGWGMAIGMLSIFSGAYLGTVGGAALSVKRPLL